MSPSAAPAVSPSPLPPFASVVELHGPLVLRFCVARVGPVRGEDVFQETMLAALRAYDGVRDPGAIRSWLLSIAARKAVDAHRARAREPDPVEDVDRLAGAADDAALRDEALWAQVRGLPEKQQQAVTLRYLADLTYPEIATVMEIAEPAVRRNVFEGLRRLRREVR